MSIVIIVFERWRIESVGPREWRTLVSFRGRATSMNGSFEHELYET
jgi:hypothetical protein